MAYRKVLIDSLSCRRRFHICFDDEDLCIKRSSVKCSHCGSTIYSVKNHPQIQVVRDEVLMKTTYLSDLRAEKCESRN